MKQAARQLFAGGISQKMGVTVSDVRRQTFHRRQRDAPIADSVGPAAKRSGADIFCYLCIN